MKSTEITARPRKRSRTSEDAEDTTVAATGKKARGRPRVDTQDATAADVSTALYSHLFAPLLRPFFQSHSRIKSQQSTIYPRLTLLLATKDADSACPTRIPAAQRNNNNITPTAKLSTTRNHR